MPTSMPVACEVYYKLRTDKIQERKRGATLSGEDSNALLEGRQNIGDFAVEFNPANELYDLFYRPLNENGQGPEVEFNGTTVRATLNGALNPLATVFNITIANPEDAGAFRVESPIQIGNEILVVSSVTPGTPTILEVEARGDHGTEAEDHANGDTVILLRYSVPHSTIRLDGFLDSGLPLRVITFLLTNAIGPQGIGIEMDVQLPDSQVKTLRSIRIQLSTTLWPEDLSNVTGLRGIRAQGTDGVVIQGGTSLTTQTNLGGFARKLLYTHEGIDLVTGEISFGRCVVIDNVVDNGNGSWTANVAGDGVFRLRFGADGAERTINWIVADDWLTPSNTSTWVADDLTEVKNSIGVPGDPLVLNTHRTTIITGASVYARCQLVNWLGVGPWVYWDGVTGSSNRADAVLFAPGADTTLPSMVTVVVRSIGLNVFLNMQPLANVEGYNYFRFYRVKIYLDAARTEELLNTTTPEHTQRGGNSAVSFNFQVPDAGEYWYEVTPVNLLGDGASTLGSFFVSGLAPTLVDGVPGEPTVVFKELLQEGLGANYTLQRPTTGHAQIGLYTAVARDNNDFDFVYNDTGFVAALDQNRNEVVATADVFSTSSVGKLIELTGIDTGGIPGQRHLFIVTEYVNERLVKIHLTWRGDNQVGLSARIGDPWWTDSHKLWSQDFFVVGPSAIASPIEESFDFAVPIAGETIYVSAFALSIFGMSAWGAPTSSVTTNTFESLVQQYESPPTPPGTTPRHALAWTTDIRVRPVDNDTIEWDAGSVEFSDGVSQAVSTTGSPRTLSPALNDGVWYVYKFFNSSTLQFTQDFSDAIGSNRIQLGIIVVTDDAEGVATVLIKGDSGGPHISAQSMAVNIVSAITGNFGEMLSGIITGVLIRTSADGRRVELSSSDSLDFFDSAGVKVGDLDVSTIAQDSVLHLLLRAIGPNRDLSLVSDLGIALYPAGGAGIPGDFSSGTGRVTIAGNLFVDAVSLHNNDIRLAGNNIEGVGDMELGSLTKDGSGAIDVNDDIDMNNHRILNVAGLGGANILAGTAVTLDPSNFGNNIPISIANVQAFADAVDDLVLGMESGGPPFTADVDFGGFDALDVGDVVLDALRKAGSGKISIESTVEFGQDTQIHFEGNEVTDIGTDDKRAANIWANAAILDALALRDGQDVAAQAGRTIIYVEGAGSNRQVKIRYPDGTTADLPGTGGDAGTDDQTAEEVSLDPSSFGGNIPVTIQNVQDFANAVDNLTLGSAVQLPPEVYLWASTEHTSPGGAVTLNWFTSHSTSMSLNQSIGSVAPVSAGSMVVNPLTTTHYRAIAGGSGLPSDTSSLLVVVSGVAPAPPVIDSFTIDTNSVAPGGSTNLRWETTDATEVEITADVSGESPPGTLDLDGSIEVTPGEAVTFTLTARNAAAVEVTAEVSVTIDYPSILSDPRLFAADTSGDELWELDPDGADDEGTSRTLPNALINPNALALHQFNILCIQSGGLWRLNPEGGNREGALIRELPDIFGTSRGMTRLGGRLLIAGANNNLLEADPDGDDDEGVILRSLPVDLNVTVAMTAYNNRLLVLNRGDRALWELDPDGDDDEGVILRVLPPTFGLTSNAGMTVYGGRLLIASLIRIGEFDPDGADDEGTVLRNLPANFSLTGMTAVPGILSDAEPIIDSFTYVRSGNSVTFSWETTHADEVRLQASGSGLSETYVDFASGLNPDGTRVQTIPQSSGVYWRIRAINNEGPTTYSDGVIPA